MNEIEQIKSTKGHCICDPDKVVISIEELKRLYKTIREQDQKLRKLQRDHGDLLKEMDVKINVQ